jgi:23S rRNA (pseudouridine1915-N3)-methyltransferase
MRVTIACVGKIKEKYFVDAIKEYSKRLSRYITLEIVEVADEKCPETLSDKEAEQVKAAEGERLLKAIKDGSYVIALAIDGKKYDSVGFSKLFSDGMVNGISHITFVIGGSLGLADKVLKRADSKMSFSDMTFPHQLMRVILLEQTYRAYRIIKNEPYHK